MGCYIIAGGTCDTWPGECDFRDQFASTNLPEILEEKGLKYAGGETLHLFGNQVSTIQIGPDLLASWGCGGALIGLYQRVEGDGWYIVDHSAYAEELDLSDAVKAST